MLRICSVVTQTLIFHVLTSLNIFIFPFRFKTCEQKKQNNILRYFFIPCLSYHLCRYVHTNKFSMKVQRFMLFSDEEYIFLIIKRSGYKTPKTKGPITKRPMLQNVQNKVRDNILFNIKETAALGPLAHSSSSARPRNCLNLT